MARSRNIKPGFFKNETLAECQPLTRLLFAGLWCLADREGRLEDRPKRIRAELLPYDDGSVEEMLDELHRAGFIVRYEAAGNRFIQVMNFNKHQTPHHKEQASIIHAPDMPKSSPGHVQDLPSSCPSDSLNLIPDSLNTDSLSSDSDESVVASKADNLQNSQSKKPSCPHQEIVALYHELLPASPRIKDWTPARAASLKARWNEGTDRQTLDWWRSLFEYIAKSHFLTGKVSTPGRKPFLLSLDWLVKAENFAKVREGRYQEGNNEQ